MATVSISADLEKLLAKLKSQKKKKSLTEQSSVFSEHRKSQLTKVSRHPLQRYIVTMLTCVAVTVRQYSNGTC